MSARAAASPSTRRVRTTRSQSLGCTTRVVETVTGPPIRVLFDAKGPGGSPHGRRGASSGRRHGPAGGETELAEHEHRPEHREHDQAGGPLRAARGRDTGGPPRDRPGDPGRARPRVTTQATRSADGTVPSAYPTAAPPMTPHTPATPQSVRLDPSSRRRDGAAVGGRALSPGDVLRAGLAGADPGHHRAEPVPHL